MAAPTQEYPAWLTPVPTIVFDGNGVPVTSTTILFLPLTYYGPSIPLGPDWTYGGLTPPPSTTPPITPSQTSVTTSTATPTLPPTLTSLTTTAIPSSSTTSSSSLSSSDSLTPPTSSASPTPIGSTGFTRPQLVGIIVGSICGFLGIFILALLAYLCYKRRRHRTASPDFSIVSVGLNGGYQIVGPDGRSTWTEGSPRHSGEEADPFLRRPGAGPSTRPLDREIGARSGAPRVARVPVPDLGTQSSAGSSSNNSGYGTLVERPTLNLLPDTARELAQQRRGPPWTSEQIQQRYSDIPTIEEDSPSLPPPPRLIDPDRAHTPDINQPRLISKSSQLTLLDADAEAATLQTARRVRAEDLASRTPPRNSTPGSGEGSSGRNSGLWTSLGLDRLGWINGNSRRSSRRDSRHASIAGYDDPEIGRALLDPPEMSEFPPPPRRLGLVVPSDRPVSSVSAQSGNSVYHDAPTSQPGTPIMPLPPLPQASVPPSSRVQASSGASNTTTATAIADSQGRSAVPPGQSHAYSMNVPNVSLTRPPSYDILDTPIPAPASQFTSTSSLRETDTASSLGTTILPFPPGLGILPHKSWTDDSSTATGPMNVTTHLAPPFYSGVTIDLLEEAPPTSEARWRSLSLENLSSGRRTTFGQFVAPDIASEQASVYTHLSPAQSRSTGSAPSRRDLSGSGSGSSHQSAARSHSSSGGGGGGGYSLSHSTSISSDARKRGNNGNVSPVMSAFGGVSGRSRSPLSPGASAGAGAGGAAGTSPSSPVSLNTPPPAHFVPERAGMHRMTSSVDYSEEAGYW